MIEQVLEATNLYKATRQVERNKGASGVDGMKTTALSAYILENRSLILSAIRTNSYVPNSILGVKIPKGQGKTRLLGIPTVVDRWLQQAVSQQLMVHLNMILSPLVMDFAHKRTSKKQYYKLKGISILVTKIL
ncbi:maturase [Formosa sp. L2A11]|uniref:maturase n=1 Tax=Formosa sp. L2A11 TaxID=2686363 RepID=UPI001E469D25|nr:maturase [Formosa sp. L2A11]